MKQMERAVLKGCRFFLVTGAVLLALCSAPVAEAKRFPVDITCTELMKLASGDQDSQQASAAIFYWLAGWWGGLRNEPYINEWRRSLLSEAIIESCRRDDNARILNAVRSVQTLPKVPDNALKIKCSDFLNSGIQWQHMTLLWLQGYHAHKSENLTMDSDINLFYDKVFAVCVKNEPFTVSDVVRNFAK